VFPEYDVKDSTSGSSAGSGGTATGAAGSNGSNGGAEAAGTSPGVGGNGGSTSVAGSTGDGGTGAGGHLNQEGGAAGSDLAGAAPMAGAGGEGMIGSGGCSDVGCQPSTCDNGMKDGTEAAVDCGDSAGECGDCSFEIEKFVIGSGGIFSGTAIVTWNATGITFDFSVVDGTPKNDSPEPWNDDAVEVFLDLNRGRSKLYESDDFQIIVPRD
jgi:hypothetical protein